MKKTELPKCPRCGGEAEIEYYWNFPATAEGPLRKAASVKCFCQSVFQVQRLFTRLERISRKALEGRAIVAWCAIVRAQEEKR